MPFLVAWVQNVLVSVGLCSLADTICQNIEITFQPCEARQKAVTEDSAVPQSQEFSFRRLARFAACPGVICGSTSFLWYYSILPALLPTGTFGDLLLHVAVDLLVFLPLNVLLAFFGNGMLTYGDTSVVLEKIRRDYPPAVLYSILIFLPADFVQFGLIPVHYQVTFTKSVGVVERTVHSYFISRQGKKAI
eukprot:TRINITY_DN5552_c0_g1_i1.p1 TRINITY_DN5552_c0_g1~~TRINITY_DN5552_c0_g1_i1.p1  ORF type:complete len:191 (-),score=38.49 TRINITY_DN5552_c0_g1_i1:62-634(-)